MAFLRIATIGNTKDNIYFEIAQQQLAQEFSGDQNNEIEFVDITGMDEYDILSLGAVHGVMYFTDIHDNPTNAETLKNLLNIQDTLSDLSLFALSHNPVTSKEQDDEKSNIKSYISEDKFQDDEIIVAPANITTEKEMQTYAKGVLATSLTPSLEFIGSIEKQTEQKMNKILSLVKDSLEFKHPYTAGHVQRVSVFAEAIARQMGCTDKEIEDIVVASALHDIGKIIIPDKILASPEKLSDEEEKQMQIHDKAGAQFLEAIASYDEEIGKKLNPEVLKAIKHHHKDWNGKHTKGQKNGTEEIDPINHEKIGKYATIIAVADCIDAMVSQRAYNNPKHILDTFRDLWSNRNEQFEPQAAEAAIVVLGQEIASLGYDPIKMFSEISDKPWKAKDDKGLQSFFIENAEKFQVNEHPEPGAYSKLGFRLNENGYFEFEGKNSTPLDHTIRFKDEMSFLTNNPDKISAIPKGIELPAEEVEKAARAQATKKFEDQDLEGKSAIERAIVHQKERDIPSEIEDATDDKEFNSSNLQRSY